MRQTTRDPVASNVDRVRDRGSIDGSPPAAAAAMPPRGPHETDIAENLGRVSLVPLRFGPETSAEALREHLDLLHYPKEMRKEELKTRISRLLEDQSNFEVNELSNRDDLPQLKKLFEDIKREYSARGLSLRGLFRGSFEGLVNYALQNISTAEVNQRENTAEIASLFEKKDWSPANKEALLHLANAGGRITEIRAYHWALLRSAIGNGSGTLIRGLIKGGMKIDEYENFFGRPALHAAVDWNRAESVQAVIDAGQDVNLRNKGTGDTALHVARAYEVLETLLANGADPFARNNNGLTPLEFFHNSPGEAMLYSDDARPMMMRLATLINDKLSAMQEPNSLIAVVPADIKQMVRAFVTENPAIDPSRERSQPELVKDNDAQKSQK